MCVWGGGLLRLEPNERSFKDSYWKYYFLEFYKIKKKKQNTQLRWGKREVKRPNIALWISKPETKWK